MLPWRPQGKSVQTDVELCTVRAKPLDPNAENISIQTTQAYQSFFPEKARSVVMTNDTEFYRVTIKRNWRSMYGCMRSWEWVIMNKPALLLIPLNMNDPIPLYTALATCNSRASPELSAFCLVKYRTWAFGSLVHSHNSWCTFRLLLGLFWKKGTTDVLFTLLWLLSLRQNNQTPVLRMNNASENSSFYVRVWT